MLKDFVFNRHHEGRFFQRPEIREIETLWSIRAENPDQGIVILLSLIWYNLNVILFDSSRLANDNNPDQGPHLQNAHKPHVNNPIWQLPSEWVYVIYLW